MHTFTLTLSHTLLLSILCSFAEPILTLFFQSVSLWYLPRQWVGETWVQGGHLSIYLLLYNHSNSLIFKSTPLSLFQRYLVSLIPGHCTAIACNWVCSFQDFTPFPHSAGALGLMSYNLLISFHPCFAFHFPTCS